MQVPRKLAKLCVKFGRGPGNSVNDLNIRCLPALHGVFTYTLQASMCSLPPASFLFGLVYLIMSISCHRVILVVILFSLPSYPVVTTEDLHQVRPKLQEPPRGSEPEVMFPVPPCQGD